MEKQPAVYILAHRRYGVLYTGVTSDLIARIWQHKAHTIDGFSSKFHVTRLVWYESHDTMHSAIEREKRIEKWRREWKVELIEKENPGWRISGRGFSEWMAVEGRDSRVRGNDEQQR